MTRKYYATTLTTFAGDNGGLQDQTQTDRTFYGDVIANINKQFGEDWTLNAQIGASIDDQRYEMAGVAGDLKTANFFTTLNLNTTEKFKLYQEGWHDQTQAIFANVEVGWRSMLYLTLTGRNEWPSMLAYSKQSSFFYPSVGLSGVISNMVDLPDWFSFLKVRASYALRPLPLEPELHLRRAEPRMEGPGDLPQQRPASRGYPLVGDRRQCPLPEQVQPRRHLLPFEHLPPDDLHAAGQLDRLRELRRTDG